jgi:hypothetical protein
MPARDNPRHMRAMTGIVRGRACARLLDRPIGTAFGRVAVPAETMLCDHGASQLRMKAGATPVSITATVTPPPRWPTACIASPPMRGTLSASAKARPGIASSTRRSSGSRSSDDRSEFVTNAAKPPMTFHFEEIHSDGMDAHQPVWADHIGT